MKTQLSPTSHQVGNYKGKEGSLLTQLEDRVNRALRLEDSGSRGDAALTKSSSLEVRSYIAGISPTPLAGTLIPNAVI